MNSVVRTVPKPWEGRAFPTGAEVMAPQGRSVSFTLQRGQEVILPCVPLSSLLIISVETGKELKVRMELVILYQQLQTVDWRCSEKNTNSS